MTPSFIHGCCVAVKGRGLLLLGESGSGKSDLALRLIRKGALLVADDQVRLEAREGALLGSSHVNIAGRLEVRGVGILQLPHLLSAPIALCVHVLRHPRVSGDLEGIGKDSKIPAFAGMTETDEERLPENKFWEYHAVRIPMIALQPFPASAPDKILAALSTL